MFTRDGVPVAGGMGDMGDMKADNTWKPYLSVTDIEASMSAVQAAGGVVAAPAMPVADLGIQTVIVDAAGTTTGLWQPVNFPGFTVLAEPGAPAWFEIHSTAYDTSVDFYEKAIGWTTRPLGAAHGITYVTFHDEETDTPLAGILDASSFSPAGTPSTWTIYWQVADADKALESVTQLGGSVLSPAQDTPFGRMAEVADPYGAKFRVVA
jgi:hypothetical protein